MSLFGSKIDIEIDGSQKSKSMFDNGKHVENKILIKKDITSHIWNDGKLNLHDIVGFICETIGKCDLILCSWSISVPAMKTLNRLRDEGLINDAIALVDLRTRKDHPEAYQMARNFFSKISILPCHAKVVVLKNEEWTISVFGSANLTNNPKQERISVCCNKEIAEADRLKILELMEKGENADG